MLMLVCFWPDLASQPASQSAREEMDSNAENVYQYWTGITER